MTMSKKPEINNRIPPSIGVIHGKPTDGLPRHQTNAEDIDAIRPHIVQKLGRKAQ